MILQIQWWFLNRIPFLWKYWAKKLKPALSKQDIEMLWDSYNSKAKPEDRYTPLQIFVFHAYDIDLPKS